MITGVTQSDEQQAVSTDERAARYGQKAIAIALSGTHAQTLAQRLERKLFDSGHAATILDIQDGNIQGFVDVIKQAGLICLAASTQTEAFDVHFDADNVSAEEVFDSLKKQQIIL